MISGFYLKNFVKLPQLIIRNIIIKVHILGTVRQKSGLLVLEVCPKPVAMGVMCCKLFRNANSYTGENRSYDYTALDAIYIDHNQILKTAVSEIKAYLDTQYKIHSEKEVVQDLEKAHQTVSTRTEDSCYHINPDCPGICLIINQEYFYPECENKYMHLLPAIRLLESRTGTEFDKNKLVDTFKKLNYEVIVKDNLTHFEMLEVIKSTVELIKDHSSLFIYILSHGLEGEVFGVNTIPVKIETIKELMCTINLQNLRGKPKILILQSCQGRQLHEVGDDDEHEYAIDEPPCADDLFGFSAAAPGRQLHEADVDDEHEYAMNAPSSCAADLFEFSTTPSRQLHEVDDNGEHEYAMNGSSPCAADLFVFYAAIPGFAAVRDKRNGTWFIQSLCDKMEHQGDLLHFDDICTLVQQDVTKKKWKSKSSTRGMVPMKTSTLTKFFYLPRIGTTK